MLDAAQMSQITILRAGASRAGVGGFAGGVIVALPLAADLLQLYTMLIKQLCDFFLRNCPISSLEVLKQYHFRWNRVPTTLSDF